MAIKKLAGKVAVVTGASSGIGQATAELLALHGYKVYGTSRRQVNPGERSFKMLPLDVTNDESVVNAVGEVIRRESRIDLLVNKPVSISCLRERKKTRWTKPAQFSTRTFSASFG